MRTNNIVLIHGLWMTPLSFEEWTPHCLERGFNVYAPAWPGMERDIRSLRRDPRAFAHVGFRQIVDHYERLVLELDAPPILIGHCVGGLVVQALVGRGLGLCGIAIAPAPAKGVWRVPWSTLRILAPRLIDPTGLTRGAQLTPRQFHYALMNDSSRDVSDRVYQRLAVPATRRLIRQAGLANFDPYAETTIDVRRNKRPPLLMIAGERDNLAPPSIVNANHHLYHRSTAITEYREFAGRNHLMIRQEGWQEIADQALDWARGLQLLREREQRRLARELQSRRVA